MVGGNAPIELRKFAALTKSFNCSIKKTKKEWEIIDDMDGQWVCGFATISGRQVKRPYVDQFEKLIKMKRRNRDE